MPFASRKRFRLNQLVWWGESIARVTAIDGQGRALALMGGPVLGDGSFNSDELRCLGLAGRLRVWHDSLQDGSAPEWLKLLFSHCRCSTCGKWISFNHCPQCGFQSTILFGRGIFDLWHSFYFQLYLSSSKQMSNLGRWLWCNEWGRGDLL